MNDSMTALLRDFDSLINQYEEEIENYENIRSLKKMAEIRARLNELAAALTYLQNKEGLSLNKNISQWKGGGGGFGGGGATGTW